MISQRRECILIKDVGVREKRTESGTGSPIADVVPRTSNLYPFETSRSSFVDDDIATLGPSSATIRGFEMTERFGRLNYVGEWQVWNWFKPLGSMLR